MSAFEGFVIGVMVGAGIDCIAVAVTVWYLTPR
jgi:hypothetical protein